MAKTSDYLALDLGAESGRGLLGRFDGERLTLDEAHRFSNGPVRLLDTLYWDLPRLFDEMKTAESRPGAGNPRRLANPRVLCHDGFSYLAGLRGPPSSIGRAADS